ncbi:MAG: pyruvate, phosphate dikinase, partial [Bacteroidales bacterium]|nr:pyruvate, phosphate dikinase [Bacteroidales bacterium]
PGRWGTRDRFIGIPVVWPQISNAKIIVEMSLKDFPLDASLGSHFFHNVISMNVGYLSVNHTSSSDFITWDILKKQKVVEETKYFKHIRFKSNLLVQMDGKKRIAMISVK